MRWKSNSKQKEWRTLAMVIKLVIKKDYLSLCKRCLTI